MKRSFYRKFTIILRIYIVIVIYTTKFFNLERKIMYLVWKTLEENLE